MDNFLTKMDLNLSEDADPVESQEWLDSLDEVLERRGPDRVRQLMAKLRDHAHERGVSLPFTANTPYINTIPVEKQAPYPGSREVERRIKSIIRWNAMAMVVRANVAAEGIGGHISTYASAATLFEVGFNHFFRGPREDFSGDQVYFQGHASPGVYARAFLEGILTEQNLINFRRELQPGGGLSSYPHPWLMPGFWQFPTVSMGLAPIMAIYQARFNRYLEDRGLKQTSDSKVWCLMGDGESDEPESLGAITLPAREKLDNLIFVINCNQQRLDGPVRGNGQIIQELEAAFRGAGWNVVKVVWASEWDDMFERDDSGMLVRRMNEMLDGEAQKYIVEDGAYIREHFFGRYDETLKLVERNTDEELRKLGRGGHDAAKVYAAYKAAVEHKGSPTVVLAFTVKGYGLGEAGEGRNVTHQQKKLNVEELREFRTRFGIPISDEDVAQAPFYRPPENSREMRYVHERRQALGGFLPNRNTRAEPLPLLEVSVFEEFLKGDERSVSTTMAYVGMLRKLMRHGEIGKYIVPIVPDEARTFGMESLFRQFGIYSHVGQLYEPVDAKSLLYYKEATDGQILEEGITEAGSISSFIAAGAAYATHGINTIPFFTYYSMFGFQRIGDLIWAAADSRCRGFLVGGTSGRTTLAGEGLQHADGHSHLLAYPPPNLKAYDPAYAYELAVVIQDGIRRMTHEQEDIFYYLTVYNENYTQPPKPDGVDEGILRGMYLLREAPELEQGALAVNLLGSGSLVNEAVKAQAMLAERGVAASVWSVTSYKELYLDAQSAERWNMLHPTAEYRVPYITERLATRPGVTLAVSDYLKVLPESIGRWIPGRSITLGTDGFGRSETREALRDFFEIDARYVTIGALWGLALDGRLPMEKVHAAVKDLEIDPDKINPMIA